MSTCVIGGIWEYALVVRVEAILVLVLLLERELCHRHGGYWRRDSMARLCRLYDKS